MTQQELETAVREAFRINKPAAFFADYACAICLIESAWNPDAHSPPGASDDALGGAYGLCQMTLQTAGKLGFIGQPDELFNPHINAWLFAKLVALNLRSVGNSPWRLIAAHNCGTAHVLHNTIPDSTKNMYVPKVLAAYEKHYKPTTDAPALDASFQT